MKTHCHPDKKPVSPPYFRSGGKNEGVGTATYMPQMLSRNDRAPALPETAILRGAICSTAHITNNDNTLLYLASHRVETYGDAEWVHYTGTGYLLRLNAWRAPVLRLKRMGISKACRRLIATLMKQQMVTILHFDAAGDVLEDFDIFDW